MEHKRFMKKVKYPLITFLTVFVVLLAVYATVGMYPFGDRQVMIIDCWHQYFPFFKEVSMRLRNGQSLLYAWNTGMGTNFLAMISYYALSPLNLLSVLVPEEYLREFFYLAIIIKTALGGAFFSIYIRGLHKKNDLSIVLFGLMYSFSAFFINYYWNTMWLDSAALLPLIMLGIHQLISESRYKLYVITFAIALMSNFYIGYFLCEFIAIYYFVIYFTKGERDIGLKDFFQNLGKIILASLTSLAMAAIILLPIFFAMQNAYGLQSYNPKKPEVYYTILEIISNMFVYVKPTVVDGMPNIYSTILALSLLILYFFSNAKAKDKIVNGVFIAFLLLSFNINYLNFAWHGFHFPNQVPYRFSFVFIFVIISLAYEGYTRISSIDKPKFLQIFIAIVVFLLFLEQAKSEHFSFMTYYITAAVFGAYFIILSFFRGDKINKDTFLRVAILLVLAEGICLTALAFIEGGSSGRNDYYPNKADMEKCIEYMETDGEFYRAEAVKRFVTNDSIHYGYRGIAQFSSAANSHVSKLTRQLGMPSDAGSNTIGYSATCPPLNGMVAIKYIMSKNEFIPLPNAQYKTIMDLEKVELLENKYFLPLGYMVNENVESLKTAYHRPFYNHEEFYSEATGLDLDLYEEVLPISDSYTNMNITSKHNGKYNYKNIDASSEGSGSIDFEIDEEGQYYLYFLNQNQKLEIAKNGASKTYKARRGVIADLGICKIGDEIRVDFDVDAQKSGYFEIELVRFNEENFAKYVDVLRQEAMVVEEVDDTYLRARIDVKSSGLLYTSIPYEKGFTVKVDGREVMLRTFNDAFIMLPLSVGEHIIEFSYSPQGFELGAIISATALAGLVIFSFFLYLKKKKRRGLEAELGEDGEVSADLEEREEVRSLELGEETEKLEEEKDVEKEADPEELEQEKVEEEKVERESRLEKEDESTGANTSL